MTKGELLKKRDLQSLSFAQFCVDNSVEGYPLVHYHEVMVAYRKGFDVACELKDAEVAELLAYCTELRDKLAEFNSHKELFEKTIRPFATGGDANLIPIMREAGKALYEVLNHAVDMGQYTSGGSTEGWAKRTLAKYASVFQWENNKK